MYFDPSDPEFHWNLFDCVVVCVGVADVLISLGSGSETETEKEAETETAYSAVLMLALWVARAQPVPEEDSIAR